MFANNCHCAASTFNVNVTFTAGESVKSTVYQKLVAQAYNLVTWEAEIGRIEILG
jgi:hypothetical protein